MATPATADAGDAVGRSLSFTFDTPGAQAAAQRAYQGSWGGSAAAGGEALPRMPLVEAQVPAPAWNLPRAQRVKTPAVKLPREVKQLLGDSQVRAGCCCHC